MSSDSPTCEGNIIFLSLWRRGRESLACVLCVDHHMEGTWPISYVLCLQKGPTAAGGFPHGHQWEVWHRLPFARILWPLCGHEQPSVWGLGLWGEIFPHALHRVPTFWTVHHGAAQWVPGECAQESLPCHLPGLRDLAPGVLVIQHTLSILSSSILFPTLSRVKVGSQASPSTGEDLFCGFSYNRHFCFCRCVIIHLNC